MVGKVEAKDAKGLTGIGAAMEVVSNSGGLDADGHGLLASEALDEISDPESVCVSKAMDVLTGVEDGIGKDAGGDPATVKAAKAAVGDVPKRNWES